MTDPAPTFGGDVLAFVGAALPEPPARVLEVGAGRGHLAADLAALGYDVVAIDPAASAPNVLPVALEDVEEPPGSFDAAVAVRSLHHVEPLAGSIDRLTALIRRGGRLVVDEIDVERFDERAARWLIEQRAAATGHPHEHPAALVAELRGHLHPLGRIRAELGRAFGLSGIARGAYLYRWELPSGLRGAEEQLIDSGAIPAVGARFLATRS